MLLDAARQSAAASLGMSPDEVTFTSSGTHAVHAGYSAWSRPGARRGSCLQRGRAFVGAARRGLARTRRRHGDRGRRGPARPDPCGSARGDRRRVGAGRETRITRWGPASRSRRSRRTRAACRSWWTRRRASVGAGPEGWSVLAASARKWGRFRRRRDYGGAAGDALAQSVPRRGFVDPGSHRTGGRPGDGGRGGVAAGGRGGARGAVEAGRVR